VGGEPIAPPTPTDPKDAPVASHLSDVWFRLTDLEVVSATGATITTADGDEYLDLTSGIGVVNTGHCHPRVVAAVQEQAARFLHAQVNCYRHDLLEPLATRLAEITPRGIDRFFFANSGAEATEAAVKLAKQATGRPGTIVFQGSFHGRTHLTMAMTTSKSVYRVGHAPLPSGVFVAPFPAPFVTGEDPEQAIDRCLRELDLLLATQTAPSEVACMMLEPVLGEGGYLPAPRRFLDGVVERCRAHGILFVADEVQSGFGRTGRMFACEHHDIEPDVLVMAKGIASGFPMSALGASAELMDRWPVGSHGGTYGGNPMGCAAALATIDVLLDGLVDEGADRGAQLLDGLRAMEGRHAAIGESRGLGCMVATEIVGGDGRPDPARAAALLAHLRDESRVLVMTCGPFGSTVRWIPPLVVTAEEVDRALGAFDAALTAVA
jgi:4-aminobutyrate aminotransferase